MSVRNWRKKQLRSGCDQTICNRIPSKLTILIFSDVGETYWTPPPYVNNIEYLIVGGGGGGGGAYDTGSAGGGGAGLVLTGNMSVIPNTNYKITIGNGGDGGRGTKTDTPYETDGTDGSYSALASVIASGGIGGKRSRYIGEEPGKGGNQANGVNVPSGGYGSGNGQSGKNGGGGGGNLSNGNGPTFPPDISIGGLGLVSNISGNDVTYGSGGQGGQTKTSNAGANGLINTGNGGNGASANSSDGKYGGSGGTGIVILKYYTRQ